MKDEGGGMKFHLHPFICIDMVKVFHYHLCQDNPENLSSEVLKTSELRKVINMTDSYINIGSVKRDISELLNRVAYGSERVVLTSRGKPKAVIVSLEDWETLKHQERTAEWAEWEAWLADLAQLQADIAIEWGDSPPDLDATWQAARADLEERHDFLRDN
jgi:prevent-host-death family protein